MGDARAQPGVRAEEVVHPVLVAGEDHDQLVALGLHHLEQDLDRLLAVVALVLGPVEVVGLVDEEHAAVGAAQHLLGLRRGVADVLADEVVAGAGDDARLGDVAEPVQDLRHLHRDRGLARARVAGERHVQRRAVGARPTSLRSRSISSSAAISRIRVFTGSERDQLVVELVEHLDHIRLGEGGAEIGLVGRAARSDLGLVGVCRLRLLDGSRAACRTIPNGVPLTIRSRPARRRASPGSRARRCRSRAACRLRR